MKQPSYREHDYAFGQIMLTLRSNMGLTQTTLADALGVSRRSVGEWEAGSKYPKPERLKAFIALAAQHGAFLAGREVDEIRALWKAARQKVLLDESWLATLVTPSAPPVPVAPTYSVIAPRTREGRSFGFPFQPTTFVGRGTELAEINRLLRDPACRLLTLIGPGGVGKTRLALETAAGHTDTFTDGAAFVSLAPVGSPSQIVSAIGDTLHLTFGSETDPAAHLLAYLRERHLLLVLDNFEHLLEGAAPPS
jgi:transcriptional regulator with XRE-family HTH domain